MTAIQSQKSYYPLNFLKTEAAYFDRSPQSPLSRAARFISTLALEILQNALKGVANVWIWIANRGASHKKEGRVVVIGSGPAGYTAAIYLARAALKPLVLQGALSGGQLMTTHEVENYPGFPDGITGPELMERLESQAKRFGAELRGEDAISVDLSHTPYIIETANGPVAADAIVISTGAAAKRLYVPGTRDGEFWQKGVSACAVCDGPLPAFRGQPLFVIGGGDTALEDALYLSKFASKVSIVHRRNELRASKILIERAEQNPKIEILYDRELTEVRGTISVEAVLLKNKRTGQTETLPARGVFIAIGHTPNTQFLKGQLETDAHGYLRVQAGTVATSAPGVFACGDVQDPHYRQAATAVGTGCMAAIDADRWLSSTSPKK